MASKIQNLIQDTVSAPLGDIIASVGQGVADAQAALDKGSLAQTLRLYQAGDDKTMQMLKDIGYQPTFYTIPEAEGDITVAMKMELSSTQNTAGATKIRMYATPVDAGYSNRYSYTAEIQARIRFKIVPIPPPDNLSNLIPPPENENGG